MAKKKAKETKEINENNEQDKFFDYNKIQRNNNQFTSVLDKKMNSYFNLYRDDDISVQKYKKSEIMNWLEYPSKSNDKRIIGASNYFFNVSNHYRRIINYPVQIASFDYFIHYSETNDRCASDLSKKDLKNDMFKASRFLKSMNIKEEFLKIAEVCFREDYFFGYAMKSEGFNSFYIKQLPSKYCKVSGVVDGCFVFDFDFGYFDLKSQNPSMFGEEFYEKYSLYRAGIRGKWQRLDIENGAICIKFADTLPYALPPFIGILPDLFDLQSYKMLKKISEELGNYILLTISAPLNKEGKPTMKFDELVDYYKHLDDRLPEGVAIGITPNKLEKYSFDKSNQPTIDSVSGATDSMFSAAGISPLIFSSDKSGSAIINASIEVDAAYIYSFYRKIERWINFQLKILDGCNNKFKIKILDTTKLNREQKLKEYIELGNNGFPVTSQIAALMGIDLLDMDYMITMENDIFNFKDKLTPLKNSHTQSGLENGRPKVDDKDLTDSGEKTRERDD